MQNHGETLKLLAKSIYQVARRLPWVKIVSILYPTQPMRLAVENLYAYILEFLLMAHGWCNESKFRHFYHGVTRPHELRYRDLLERIMDCSTNIIELAAVGSQARIHVMHETQSAKLQEVISTLEASDEDRTSQLDSLTHAISRLESAGRGQEKKLDLVISLLQKSGLTINDMLNRMESRYTSSILVSFKSIAIYAVDNIAIHSIHTSAQLDTNQQLSQLQLSQVLSSFPLALDDPNQCYKHHLFFRRRRAFGMGMKPSTNQFWLSPNLMKLSSSSTSNMVILKGPFTLRSAMHDFSIDSIQALATSRVPIVWALAGANKTRTSSTLTDIDLMKHLMCQALRLSSSVQTESQIALRHSQFQTLQTQAEWFGLFKQVVANLGGQIYFVVDLATVRSSLQSQTGFNFIQELRCMLQGTPMMTKVKIILLAYEADWIKLLPRDASESMIVVRAMGSKRPQGKAMQSAVNTRVFPRNRGPNERVQGRRLR